MRDGNIHILSQYIRVEKLDPKGNLIGSVRKWNDGETTAYSRITCREKAFPYVKGTNESERQAEAFLQAEAAVLDFKVH